MLARPTGRRRGASLGRVAPGGWGWGCAGCPPLGPLASLLWSCPGPFPTGFLPFLADYEVSVTAATGPFSIACVAHSFLHILSFAFGIVGGICRLAEVSHIPAVAPSASLSMVPGQPCAREPPVSSPAVRGPAPLAGRLGAGRSPGGPLWHPRGDAAPRKVSPRAPGGGRLGVQGQLQGAPALPLP